MYEVLRDRLEGVLKRVKSESEVNQITEDSYLKAYAGLYNQSLETMNTLINHTFGNEEEREDLKSKLHSKIEEFEPKYRGVLNSDDLERNLSKYFTKSLSYLQQNGINVEPVLNGIR